jgi:DUF971 family protein
MKLRPVHLQVVASELAIRWSDDAESYLSLEALRRACPCASCGGEPDVLGRVIRPEVVLRPASFELNGWQFVGGYALQPQWGDGHQSGLYTFDYLRRLAQAAGGNGP